MTHSVSDVDYVIVGAGSAGCVLAARLSEVADAHVLLLEAGGSDRSLLIDMPAALSIPMNMPRYTWGYATEPEPWLDGRRMHCPRGKVIGGCSSINGMVYVRGHPCDFEAWEAMGATGWGYRHCLPYFRRAESWEGGEDAYRGGDGPLATSTGNHMANPLYRAFIAAGREAGYPLTDDYNGCQQEGFAAMQMTVKDGARCSAARAYLDPVLQRSNLTLESRVLVERVVIEGGRAVGVVYRRGRRRHEVRARREVVLAAGAIGTPLLLQRSGIGPASALKLAGVPVLLDRPGVGANLQDHLEVYFQFSAKQPITLNGWLSSGRKLWIGAQWLLTKKGLGATNHFESGAFIRSRAGVEWPDLQYHFLPGAMRYDGREAFPGHGFQVHVGPMKPKSRGRVHLSSPDPEAPPSILFNYLAAPEDRADFRRAVRLTREIMAQPAMDPYREREVAPGAEIESDEAIDAWVRAHCESAYHPSCTCRMGRPDDPMAVLDHECRVIGVEALRVVDASIFPVITNGNLNAPTIMAAEKAADLIRGRPPLPPSNQPFWLDPDWERRQRPDRPVRILPDRSDNGPGTARKAPALEP